MIILILSIGAVETILLLCVIGLLTEQNNKLERFEKKFEKDMATIADLLADVSGESTLIDSLSAMITGLQQQVKDALSGATLPPAVQAQVDQAFALAEANKAALAAALVTGTPAASASTSDAPAEPVSTP